jgi:hypothetical protein
VIVLAGHCSEYSETQQYDRGEVMPSLFKLIGQYRELQELDAEDVPEEVIRDTLEAIEGDVQVKATNVAMFCKNLEMFAETIEGAAKEMKDRAARVRRKADSVRAYLLTNMQAAKISKIQVPEFTLAIRKNPPSVVIFPDAQVPDEYMVKPEAPPPYPDKKKIGAALKDGVAIDFARLEQGERVDIKV